MNLRAVAISDPNSRSWSKITFGILVVALALRFALAWSGGQGSWPDESRFQWSREAVYQFAEGHWKVGWLGLIGSADHLFFKVASVPAALLDRACGVSDKRGAAYLGLFSVAALGLIGAAARMAGASRRESCMAVFFAACANTLFYYTRHLLPYDMSLAFCMGSLTLAMGPQSGWRSFFAGFLAGLGFLTYDGYWMLGGVILIVHVLRASRIQDAFARAGAAVFGLIIPIGAAVGADHLLGVSLIDSFRHFSGTILQGDFGKGHVLIWQYLWSAEGWFLVFLLVAAAYAVARICQQGSLGRPVIWMGAAGLIFLGLWACSDLVKVFVVYGRTARMLVPFLCLTAAWAIDDIWSSSNWTPRALLGFTAIVGALAAINQAVPLWLEFPPQFMAQATASIRKLDPGAFKVLNASWFGPDERIQANDPRETTLLVHRHPLQFEPYLYEGFNELQRTYLTSHDLSMRLVESRARLPSIGYGYPGPIRLRVRFPVSAIGLTEPLVTAGIGGDASHLSIQYADLNHVVFGFESPYDGVLMSPSVPVDLDADHELMLFFGSMLSEARPLGETRVDDATWERLRQCLMVALDDQVVFAAIIKPHDVSPHEITLGLDLSGYTDENVHFDGSFLSAQPVDLVKFAGLLRDEKVVDLRKESEWDKYPGPLHFLLRFPKGAAPRVEPLLTTRPDDKAGNLCLVFGADETARVSLTEGDDSPILSEPLNVGPDGLVDLNVSLGMLMPPEGSKLYLKNPRWAKLRNQDWIEANGSCVFARFSQLDSEAPDNVRLFSNLLGTPSIQPYFTGRIEAVEAKDPDDILSRIPPVGLDSNWFRAAMDGYPGPIRLKVQFPKHPRGTNEPLMVSGVPNAGDFLFVRYSNESEIQFGVDHWGVGGPLSKMILPDAALDFHEIIVSEGSLLPPEGSPIYKIHPEWEYLRNWIVVAMDGKPVIVLKGKTYPSSIGQVTTGLNLIGGSTVVSRFDGKIDSAEMVSPDFVVHLIEMANGASR